MGAVQDGAVHGCIESARHNRGCTKSLLTIAASCVCSALTDGCMAALGLYIGLALDFTHQQATCCVMLGLVWHAFKSSTCWPYFLLWIWLVHEKMRRMLSTWRSKHSMMDCMQMC
jgi:hypothetical protein